MQIFVRRTAKTVTVGKVTANARITPHGDIVEEAHGLAVTMPLPGHRLIPEDVETEGLPRAIPLRLPLGLPGEGDGEA